MSTNFEIVDGKGPRDQGAEGRSDAPLLPSASRLSPQPRGPLAPSSPHSAPGPRGSSTPAPMPLPAPESLGVTVRGAVPGDLAFIDGLQKGATRAVGWMPTGQLEGHIERGHVLIAERSSGQWPVSGDQWPGREQWPEAGVRWPGREPGRGWR